MKAIAILPEGDDTHPTTFRAVTADGKAAGRTPGEALDALTSQLGAEEAGAAVVVQLFRPDSHFTAQQSERLSALMARWRTARDAGSALPPAEQAELEKLVEDELHASAERSAQMSRELETTGELRRLRVDEKKVGPRANVDRPRSHLLSFLLYLTMVSNVTVCGILLAIGLGLGVWAGLVAVVLAANTSVCLLAGLAAYKMFPD
ncbi:MAG TPA: hypothetical protein VF521_14300, partial [Pyrinomonadaceae bacterium]